ncbi:MAG: hypothetical protein HYT98_03840 [Candidatus Sungbacteria bacterium]|nr:hypothetical protein [Candidatus Sungbacteria bacterium]
MEYVDNPPKRRGRKARKILAILIVFVIGIVGIYWMYDFGFFSPPLDISNKNGGSAVPTENPVKLSRDSDGDGLKDWEEIFYKTDPQKADSDGDGTPDGEEVAKNRNPLKPGPGDELAIPKERGSENPSPDKMSAEELLQEAAQKNVNLTDYFVQNFLGGAGLDGIQKLLEPGMDQKISSEFITFVQNLSPYEPFSEKSIPDSEIIISPDSNDAAIKNYFNSVAGIYEKYVLPLQGADELEFLAAALDEESPEPLDNITPLFNAVSRIAEDLKKLAVPRDIISLHKQELWYVQKGIEQIGLIQKTNPKDAVYALVVMSARLKLRRESTKFHQEIIPDWLKARGIAFTENEKAVLLYPQIRP